MSLAWELELQRLCWIWHSSSGGSRSCSGWSYNFRPSKGKYSAAGTVNAIPGANLPLATLGVFILWMGWFGFNGGSTLKLGGIAVANEVANVFLNTNAAASGGLIAALIVARMIFGKADLTMALNGALAGLVAITAEPADPSPLLATIIGGIGGVIVVFSIVFLDKIKIDDPVGAISVHGTVEYLGYLPCFSLIQTPPSWDSWWECL